jgi:hypothetical protein
LEFALDFIKKGRKVGHSLKILSLLGGIPAGNIEKPTIETLKLVDRPDLQVMVEMDNYLVQNTSHLAVRVIGKNKR